MAFFLLVPWLGCCCCCRRWDAGFLLAEAAPAAADERAADDDEEEEGAAPAFLGIVKSDPPPAPLPLLPVSVLLAALERDRAEGGGSGRLLAPPPR